MTESKEGNIEIEEIDSEIDDDYSDDDLYKIKSWGADLSFRELITMYKENELLKPELQRNYVWTRVEASRFIETLLLGLPVPSIFLAKTRDEKRLIVDGYQRIMTVYDFVEGVFSGDGKAFQLSNSKKINDKWRRSTFKELSETEQRKIKSTTIHAIVFEQTKPEDGEDTSLFQVFERINTGGQTLMPQEIRNCVYQGDLNRLLIELNKNQDWRELYGTSKQDSRMRDLEFILRFFTLSRLDLANETRTSLSLKKLLNQFMGVAENNSKAKIAELKSDFLTTMKTIHSTFGKNAFRNISSGESPKYTPRFHPTIFDSISVATYRAIKSNIAIDKNIVSLKRDTMLKDENFRQFVSSRTTDTAHMKGRFSTAGNILFGLTE